MTRVALGASPDWRAARRASVPRSSTFLRRFFISTFRRGYFLHRAPCLVDCFVGVGKRPRIRIGDVNSTERLPADLAGRLTCGPLRIIERVVLIRVTVRPAVHGDSLNVARGIKSSGGKHAPKLSPDIPFERFKFRGQKFRAPRALLVARG